MKKLYLVRHAKSSWSFNGLSDFERPLGKRGRRDVIRMGTFLKKEVPPPNVILSSGASRAFYTALFLADAWGYSEENIVVSESLYHADAHGFMSFLKGIDGFDTVAIFGHNPGLTSFYNHLCQDFIENIPTCAIAGLSFDINSWQDVSHNSGKRMFFHVPKKI